MVAISSSVAGTATCLTRDVPAPRIIGGARTITPSSSAAWRPFREFLRVRCKAAILAGVSDLSEELSKREALMHALAAEFAGTTTLSRTWLSRVDFGWGPERLLDTSKGIWNPRSYSATLTIVSDPDSEYDDGDHGGSLYRYSYEKRPAGQYPSGGSNAQLREAMNLGLPIVMLRKVANGQFVPIMPVYVVEDEPEHRRFVLALDESLRFLPDPANLSEPQRRYAEQVVRRRVH
jgi:putative restriction endonuclease